MIKNVHYEYIFPNIDFKMNIKINRLLYSYGSTKRYLSYKRTMKIYFFHNTMCFHKMILLEIQAPIVYEYFSRVSLNCHSNQIFLNNIDIQKLVSHVHHEYVVSMLCHRKTTCYSMCKITFSDHVWHLYGSPDRSYVQSLSHTGHMYTSFPETNENIIYYSMSLI